MKRQLERMPTSPGEILKYEFLEPLHMSQATIARLARVSSQTIHRLVNGKFRISPELAIEFSRIFSTTPQFWLNAQSAVDIYNAHKKKEKSSLDYQHLAKLQSKEINSDSLKKIDLPSR